MKGIVLACSFLFAVPGWTQSVMVAPSGSQAVVQPPGTEFGVNRFELARYIDPDNLAKWSSAANCTIDLGVCIEGAIADLPTKTINGTSLHWGTIYVAAGDYVLQTPISPGPLVAIEMAGPNSVRITSRINGDAIIVRDAPYNNDRGSSIGGFTLIGPGNGYVNAVGIHTGDLNFARFHDFAVGGFTGGNSSCFWVDDQAGWFERNTIEHVSLGEVQTATGNQSLGCTKYVRFTGQQQFRVQRMARFEARSGGRRTNRNQLGGWQPVSQLHHRQRERHSWDDVVFRLGLRRRRGVFHRLPGGVHVM